MFADEYLHIHEVVHACNALGLYQVCPPRNMITIGLVCVRGSTDRCATQLMEFGFKPARAAPDAVTRNKATAVVKHILDQRGDLRQRPRPPPKRLAPPDTTTFMGKFGAVQQPLGITAVEEAAARRPPPAKTGEAEAWLDFMRTVRTHVSCFSGNRSDGSGLSSRESGTPAVWASLLILGRGFRIDRRWRSEARARKRCWRSGSRSW